MARKSRKELRDKRRLEVANYKPQNANSLPASRIHAVPARPARAVRPQRWENDLVSVGGSN